MVTFEGFGCLAHITIGATEEVVSTHAFVGSTMTVVERNSLQELAVGGYLDIVTVKTVCPTKGSFMPAAVVTRKEDSG
jgi:hypothetical protein